MSWTRRSWTAAGSASDINGLAVASPLIANQPRGLSARGEEAWIVGQLIAERARRGLSQEALAARVGVGYAQLARWESLTWRPLPPNLVAWAQALDLRLVLAPRGVEPAAEAARAGGSKTRGKTLPGDGTRDFPPRRGRS